MNEQHLLTTLNMVASDLEAMADGIQEMKDAVTTMAETLRDFVRLERQEGN